MNTDIQKLLRKKLMSEETAQEYIKRMIPINKAELEKAKIKFDEAIEKISQDLDAIVDELSKK